MLITQKIEKIKKTSRISLKIQANLVSNLMTLKQLASN